LKNAIFGQAKATKLKQTKQNMSEQARIVRKDTLPQPENPLVPLQRVNITGQAVETESSEQNKPNLFSPKTIRGVTFKNRIGVSPMCQYSSFDGFASDFHLTHLGSFAFHGSGLVIMEATAVAPQGRISPQDNGIWKDEHIPNLKRITEVIKFAGAVPGIQIAHAGRKASTYALFHPKVDEPVPVEEGGWDDILAPSAIPFKEGARVPKEITVEEIKQTTQQFVDAAIRANKAGFQVLELHFAHGYLASSFLSPHTNRRNDNYGGSFENRIRFALETAEAVRKVWPQEYPLFVRISAADYIDPVHADNGQWTVHDSVELAKRLKAVGVDVIDCSSGGNSPFYKTPTRGEGYQIPLAEQVKAEAEIDTAGVGSIYTPSYANSIVQEGKVDFVLLGRQLLDEPSWPTRAGDELGYSVSRLDQYKYGKFKKVPLFRAD
jgi:2,4-dienoyl-CoA reductase-like NADH-dependent reductase (Old Yellow Enzyme family)